MTQCGYPRAQIQYNVPSSDYDVAYVFGNYSRSDDINQWQFDWKSTDAYNKEGASDVYYNSTRYSDDMYLGCQGPNSNAWLVITKVADNKQLSNPMVTDDAHLKDGNGDLVITFTPYQGYGNFAQVLTTFGAVFMAIGSLALF